MDERINIMKHVLGNVVKFGAFGLLGISSIMVQVKEGRAFDMDCKVILCIAGGFPAPCIDAYRYMIKRITRFRPLPPFGFCPMSNGTEYSAHSVDYKFLSRGPDAYDCPSATKLFYNLSYEEHGQETETAFCYSHTTSERFGWGRDQEYRTVYHNQSSPQLINFQLRITIEPGTEHEYRSPLFRINTATGYFSQHNLQ